MKYLKVYIKRFLLLITAILFALGLKAQTITGKVYRLGTDSAIASASVYYGGTIHGTVTDNQGNFALAAKQQQIPVIVSCIGYYSAAVNYEPGKPLIIYLKPKLTALQAVTIRADGMKRSDEIAMFTKEFLGTSAFALSCAITNIDDVNMFYNAKTKTLTADCDKPIIIENKKLGYTVSYYLDKFIDTPTELIFSGNYIFTENTELPDQDKIKRNREVAYKGSRMQLIRALWNHTINKTDFYLSNQYGFTINEDHIIKDSLQQKYITWKDKILINYHGSATTLIPPEAASFIDKNGFYSSSLKWAGYLTHQRIGDLLPFDYQSEKDAKKPLETAPSALSIPLNKLVSKPNNQLVFEKTYLHTDRDIYAPGDTLWFKAYLMNAQDNIPANSSGNLYVELISPDAKIIGSELIRLDGGLGNGDFDLADTLAPGQYSLRSYTNWMRNFGDNFIFEKEIVLAGSPEVAVAPAVAGKGVAEKKLAAKEVAVKNKQGNTANATATATKSTATILPIIRFYPEGGSLVEGISSLVAVKADDGFGRGLPALGIVLTAAGDTISRFSCDSLGMGLFALLPVKGQVYHAVVNFANGVPKQVRHDMNFELPSPLSQGLALQVKQTDSLLRVVVSSNNADIPTIKPAYTLTVKHAGITLLSQQFQLSNNQTSVKIPTASLPEGIAAITLYDETGKPNCERLVYIHQSQTTEKVSISTDKKAYQPKEKVTVNINAPANSSLSMAIVDAGIVPGQADDIVSYLRLQSEIKGNVEHARRYFDTTNVNRSKQLDLLLMTQGWRDFIWRRLADTAINISYAAENGVNVSGKVEDEVNHKPMPNLNVSLFADAAKGNKIFSANTDAAGRFNVNNLMLYGKQNVKLASVNNKGEKRGSFLVDTIVPMLVKAKYKGIIAKADYGIAAAIANKSLAMQKASIKGITRLKEVKIQDKNKQSVILRNGESFKTWGPPEIFNITQNDFEYKTLQWYILQKSKYAVSSTDPDEYIGFGGTAQTKITVATLGASSGERTVLQHQTLTPLLFINGVELSMDDAGQARSYRSLYFLMPISKFKKIVLQRVVGIYNEDKYLLYLTLIDDYMTDNPGSLSIDIPGYYRARTFYQPPPNAKPKLADYRNTIHWEPNIKTDEAGKATVNFYNAAPPTDIRVVVQGITDKGMPVSAAVNYTIK